MAHFKTDLASRPATVDTADVYDRTLIIGDSNRWKDEGRITSGLRDFAFLELSELNARLLEEHQPDIILSPLVGDNFDVIDVVTQLDALGYTGRYRAIAETAPDTAMILREVSAIAPEIDFDLLVMVENPQEQALRDVSDDRKSA